MLQPPGARRIWRAALWAAFAWAVANCAYVYIAAHGAHRYRVETAALVFVALLLPALAYAPGEPTRPAWPPRAIPIVLAVAAAAWLIDVLPESAFPFLSDDYVFLSPAGAAGGAGTQFFRPLFTFIFAVLQRAGGGSPVPFHLAAFALHAGAGALVFQLTRRVYRSTPMAAIAAALFVVNPLQLETTLWVSGLQDALWTFFALAAMCVHAGADSVRAGRTAATALLCAAALLSKETAVCAIALVPLVDLARGRRPARVWTVYAVIAMEVGAYLWIRSRFAPAADARHAVALGRYFLKQLLVTPYRVFLCPWSDAAVAAPPALVGAIGIVMLMGL